jgi:hypothetical protein
MEACLEALLEMDFCTKPPNFGVEAHIEAPAGDALSRPRGTGGDGMGPTRHGTGGTTRPGGHTAPYPRGRDALENPSPPCA